ncbi:hypothetical protein ALC60_05986 [Trachymyrmex zeteki]|uniref:Uncharacterized protein n=1 Tax=Mycetomoellerius zeteki TaxID=64791 RepID=A0A151X4C5_9HYME|nr:hypothetical protein ALC60_05986 [Trachymyrmex zeteki]
MGLEVAEAGAGAVGALLFAVEGGGSWGRKGGRRIDPDGAWLTADEAVTRDESRRDGRTEKAPPRFSAPPRGAPLSPNGFWRKLVLAGTGGGAGNHRHIFVHVKKLRLQRGQMPSRQRRPLFTLKLQKTSSHLVPKRRRSRRPRSRPDWSNSKTFELNSKLLLSR